MKEAISLKDMLWLINEYTEFSLYYDKEKVGTFKKEEIGYKDYIENVIDHIEVQFNTLEIYLSKYK